MNQGNTTGADGWGFMFTTGTGQDYLNQGGILRDRGLANASGFKIDTSYNNVGGITDSIDADKTNNLRQICGVKIGYGTFVANGTDGTSRQVGSNALGSKDRPINKIQYADNTTNIYDGKFHGQRFNDVVLNYNARNEKITASYAGKAWEASLRDLGINKTNKYNFLVTSSHMANRYSYGIMRTNLDGITITTPQDLIVDGEPEVSKIEVPFEKKREFNPNLAPGTERVKQEGEPTEEITTPAVDEIIEFGPGDVDSGVDSDINEATNSKVASNNESNTKLDSYENVSNISNTEMVSNNSEGK
ncbi:G5 domain-containing protein [Staphylococcus sp. AS1337]|uniref:G5 domain-containing protein n=1 Tax=Staphylococcus sp. AS1337 TaxID=3434042 RepID=UPI003F573C46